MEKPESCWEVSDTDVTLAAPIRNVNSETISCGWRLSKGLCFRQLLQISVLSGNNDFLLTI